MKKATLKIILSAEYLFKLGNAIYIIGTSIYDIKEDVTKLKKEHGLLLIGIFVLIKSIKELLDKIKTVQLIVEQKN